MTRYKEDRLSEYQIRNDNTNLQNKCALNESCVKILLEMEIKELFYLRSIKNI